MKAPDWYNLIAVERGQPAGWSWFSLKAVGPSREHGGVMVTGAVPGGRFTRGPRSGEINWSKATGRAELLITFADIDARADRWEAETGLCSSCGGDGTTARRMSSAGVETEPCRRCNGNGGAGAGKVAQ